MLLMTELALQTCSGFVCLFSFCFFLALSELPGSLLGSLGLLENPDVEACAFHFIKWQIEGHGQGPSESALYP